MGFYLYFCSILVGYLILFGVGIVGGLILLLRLQMVYTVTVKHFKICTPYQEKTSHKCTTGRILLRNSHSHVAPDTKCRTRWMACDGRCSNILLMHTAHTYCYAMFMSSDHKWQPQRLHIHMAMCRRVWYSGVSRSPKNSLQLGYTNFSIIVTNIWISVLIFANCCNNSGFSTLKWLSVVDGVTSKNTTIFIATIIRTSNLTQHDRWYW